DLAVARPRRQVRPAAPIGRVSVGRTEPLRLSVGQNAMLRAVGAADADIRPVVAGVALEVTVLVEDPPPVWRPARAEVEMVGMPDDAHAVRTVGVARPDFVAARARQMKRDAPPVRAEAQSVRKPFPRARELPRIG